MLHGQLDQLWDLASKALRDLTTGPFFTRCADYGAPPAKTTSIGSAANNRGFRAALTPVARGVRQKLRHLAQRIAIPSGGIAFLLGLPSLVLGFLGVIGQSDVRIAAGSLGAAVAVGAVLMLIAHLVSRERSHPAVEAQDSLDEGGAGRDAAGSPDKAGQMPWWLFSGG